MVGKEVEEQEIRKAIFDIKGGCTPGLDDFHMALLLIFWEDVKQEMLDFMNE